jgi:hypothetical protein
MAPNQYCKLRRCGDRSTYTSDCLRCSEQSSKHNPESIPSEANRWQQTDRKGFLQLHLGAPNCEASICQQRD